MSFPIPEVAVYTLLVISWLAVAYAFWFKPYVWPKLDGYFYKRRQMRKLRNYVAQNVVSVSAPNFTEEKVTKSGPRHRR